ncbi:MAG: transglycosylase domain-containing protein [Chloroflexota bacterium]
MPSTVPILRARRDRRLAKQRAASNRTRSALLSLGMVFSIILAVIIFVSAFAYADVTRDLPSIELLPRLLNPPDGLLLQPTQIYDRTGLELLYTFAPTETPRRYIPINAQNPQHLPQALADAVIAMADPEFSTHAGYALYDLDEPERHPTLAQRLVADLLLYNEPPSLRRALRERILAAQITSHFGRTQILEWYLNSTHYGRYAFGAEAAAQLYFDKSASELSLAEAAILAATSETPSLNPLDAPEVAIQRGREVLHVLDSLGLVDSEEAADALAETPSFQPAPQPGPQPAPAFVNLVLAQLDSRFPRARIERGGLMIFTSLDFDLQEQASCVTEIYATRLAGLTEPKAECNAARFLPSLPPGITIADSSASAIIIDPKTGQVLAAVGETLQGVETPLFAAHRPGSSLDAFVYLTGFTRGLSPASLVWDVAPYGDETVQNFDGQFHGPMRLRVAMANDYQIPAETIRQQMGMENVTKIASSFGIDLDADASLLQLAGAYGVFGTQGTYFGQSVDEEFVPVTVLRVEGADHSIWLDWTTPNARAVVTPALAYLMTDALSDESARWPSLGRPNVTEIGRPAGVKMGQTGDGLDAWSIGYTPSHVVVTWTGAHEENDSLSPRLPAVLWSALMQYASRNLPSDGWTAPQGITTMTVCDPSGLLPTKECPNLVSEVFLNGNEPIQADNLFREFSVNRETGFQATVFTPPQLIDTRIYMVVPDEARSWAESAGLAVPPSSFDAIQAPAVNPNVHITAPALFAEVNGRVQIAGTAAGDDFAYYRVQVGKGLNPQNWIQVGVDVNTPVTDGLLAEWDTTGLNGLYAVQLLVVHADQRVETAIIQVTIKP